MTTEEFIEKGKAEYGEIFEPVVRYAAGMLCRGVDDMTNCIDLIQDLDDYSY